MWAKQLEHVSESAERIEQDGGVPMRGHWIRNAGPAGQVMREGEVNEKNGEEPAEVVGQWNAEPAAPIAPAPTVEKRAPDGILGEVPRGHDDGGEKWQRDEL